MSDETSTKTRAVAQPSNEVAPAWAQQLFLQMSELQNQFQALRLSATGPPPLPSYPSAVTSPALSSLSTDPRLPDFLKPTIAALSHTLDQPDERGQTLVQAAYESIVGWVLTQATAAPPDTSRSPALPPRPLTPHRQDPASDRFVNINGRPHYRSSQGKLWDTTQSPPYPCRRCQQSHWSWNPCPASRPASYPNGLSGNWSGSPSY